MSDNLMREWDCSTGLVDRSTSVMVEAVRRFVQNQPFESQNQRTAPAVAIR
jgi:hypothetical protein